MNETAFENEAAPLPPDEGAARELTPASAASGRDTEGDFESLSVAGMLDALFRRPGKTFGALIEVTRWRSSGTVRRNAQQGLMVDEITRPLDPVVASSVTNAAPPTNEDTPYLTPDDVPSDQPRPVVVYFPPAPSETTMMGARTTAIPLPRAWGLEAFQWLLRAVGFGVVMGGQIFMLFAPRSEISGLNVGAPFLLLGFVLWVVSEFVGRAPTLRLLNAERSERMMLRAVPFDLAAILWRFALAVIGAIGSLLTWRYTAGNMFTLEGVFAWFLSIFFWCWAVAPLGWSPLSAVRAIRVSIGAWRPRITRSDGLTLIALALIMIVAVNFRFTDFDLVPPEMTSDHVEKLLDANNVLTGRTNVFFVNNHGRDALQFYLLAGMSQLPGLDLNFHLLKLLTALEGLITIPLIWLMGRVIIGRGNPTLGNLVGLAAAALVATSGWHVMLSRLGLRIVLTPLVVSLLLIFLARALRGNRRGDWIGVGLVLGFGVYTYQAVRMLPVVVIAGFGIAILLGVWNWRSAIDKRAFWNTAGRMTLNLFVAGVVAFVVFVPLFRFSAEYPEDFWRRASGRLFGDSITQDTDADGNLIFRQATLGERLESFQANLPALSNNLRTAFLMYNWKGDVAWINNAPNYPTLDPVISALFLVGIAAWIARMIERRDPVDWLMLPMIFIMLLPTALSIAYPIENPSATRASGTLPPVFLLASYALVLLGRSLARIVRGRIGAGLAIIGAAALIGGSYYYSALIYFNNYYLAYRNSSLPYSDAGDVLRSFAESNGYGNAYVLAYQYWWDHRALGIEGGRIDFPNGVPTLERVAEYMMRGAERTNDYHFDPNKEMLFFYSPLDTAADSWLRAFFPFGVAQTIQTYQPEDVYMIYRVPPIGDDGFAAFLAAAGIVAPGA
ncbi:MAG: hypothetical protein SGI73_03845 [Chloroflexota bacterium]|nr:hypothetical protein [Chloroflexota bacterium]